MVAQVGRGVGHKVALPAEHRDVAMRLPVVVLQHDLGARLEAALVARVGLVLVDRLKMRDQVVPRD